MTNEGVIQGVFINVPVSDWSLLKELIRKFGWQAETPEQLLDRFVKTRPASPEISEDEIAKEVMLSRYGK